MSEPIPAADAEQLAADRRRRWMVLSAATVPLTIAFWAIAFAFVVGQDEAAGGAEPAAATALGLALLPLILALVAYGSRHRLPLFAVPGGALLGLSVGIPVIAVAGDPATGLVAGFGSAIAVALHRPPTASRSWRFAAVAIASALTLLLIHSVPFLALAGGPAFAVMAVGAADELLAQRSAASPADGG